ncbi:MAG: peptidase MA family metallohydrolase, partial [bacterium]
FKVIYYPGGEAVAEFAARAAEEFYAMTRNDLNMELEAKTPLIIYLSPTQFAETNVITDLIEEGVGGFSELIKNRIVVPFNGSYHDLYHVIGHELTHIFEFQMFYRSRLAALLGAVGEFQVPLWIMEGFAEFQSGWVNVNSDVFMRDLVINNRLVPLVELNDNYGYLAYREGESFFHYVAERYGRQKVYEFMNTLKAKRNLEATFNAVFGMQQSKMGAEWERWLRLRYLPQVTKLSNFDEIAERLTDHNRDGSVYNIAPAISPSGTKIAMISDREEYADCYLISALSGQVLRKLIKGGRSGGFEGLHLLRPAVTWSPDEKMIAIVTTTSGRDNIALVDVNSGKVCRRIYAQLDGLYSPRFSADGRKLVFIGLKNGFSDIYVVEVNGGEPRRLTYDMYEERDPEFSPGGDSIVFISDRPEPGEEWMPGRYAVWLMDEMGELLRLSERGSFFGFPVWAHTGEYIFWVYADSFSQNIAVYSLAEKQIVRRTDFLGEVSHLSLSKDAKKLAFAYFSNVGWDVCVIFNPLDKIPPDTLERKPMLDTVQFEQAGLDLASVKPVGFNLSLDYVSGAASYTAGAQGFSGTIDIAFSDIMGNHRFELYTDLFGDILNSNAIFYYWLLPYRIDYGFAIFQLFDIPIYIPRMVLAQSVDRGGLALVCYPFDKFSRIEAALTGVYSDVSIWFWKGGWYLSKRYPERLFYGNSAFVFDNTFWPDQFGPVRGTRLRLETGSSFLSSHQFEIIYGDVRNYQLLVLRFVFDKSLIVVVNFGDVSGYYIGGEEVRGYNWGEFYNEEGPGMGLFNFELRYPFIDRLKIAFPLPIDIRGINGVLFLDGGMVFRNGMRICDGQRFDDLKLGFGVGLRIPISFFNIKLDFAKPLSVTDDRSWKFIFELGYDF